MPQKKFCLKPLYYNFEKIIIITIYYLLLYILQLVDLIKIIFVILFFIKTFMLNNAILEFKT